LPTPEAWGAPLDLHENFPVPLRISFIDGSTRPTESSRQFSLFKWLDPLIYIKAVCHCTSDPYPCSARYLLTEMLGASRRLLFSRSVLARLSGCTSRAIHSPSLKMSNLANFKVPSVSNEPNKHYAKGSADRDSLASAISAFVKKSPLEIPLVIGGKSVGRPCFLRPTALT
jgi:hypothetical protein